ncbi:extracellular solute-binding protein [Demequina sp. SYSU T00039]|uniref:Extracellular solute-binding protein n=1 Tax=Demequina lignilytica TaxID=3051663 RepID=A0AAW7M9E6_9MICO|nr:MULTISPECIES: extracellular solute-binding protein [unclassified Demequina]MDN4479214.1 extracellular solute-binding protein [Demequina sp. SYSU T00039-1]MDN4487927.1 extracellular solute-binding protein [Demequina sp. SYSU T00039]MDN4491733.1 extracellular solute-binding protein [Demequina sp. SYSU T00068]
MSTTRRIIGGAAAVTAGALALGLAGCSADAGEQAGGESPDELTIWWIQSPDSPIGQGWQMALDEFEAAHPEVEVTFETKSWDQLRQTGQMILNSPEAPDILEYPKGNASAGTVVKAGLLTDLEDVAVERGWTEILPESLQTVGRYDERGLMGSGALYGVPGYGEYVSVFYNVDVLAERGYEPPTTVAEFETIMADFTADGVTPIALGASDYPLVHLVYALALSEADQQWVRDFQFFDGPVDFHDAAWTFAAEKIAEWTEAGYIGADATGIDSVGAATGFKSGANPFFVSGSWFHGEFATDITDFEWGTFRFPGSGLSLGSGGHIWVVPAQSESKELAYDFIDYALSPEVQTAIANLGGIPVAADRASVTDPVGQMAVDDFDQILADDALGLYPDWPVAGYYEVFLAAGQQLVLGSTTPDEFLDTIGAAYETGKADAGL